MKTATHNSDPFIGLTPDTWRSIKPPPWVVPGFIRKGYIMLLTGIPGSGKSLFAGGLGLAAASCQGFLGQSAPPHPMRVAYLGLDASHEDYLMFLPRIATGMDCSVGRAIGPDGHIIPFQLFFSKRSVDVVADSKRPKASVTPEGRDLNGLILAAGENKAVMIGDEQVEVLTRPDLLIVDCLRKLHSGEENDSSHMSKVMDRLRALANQGVAIVVIHHEGKFNEGSGSKGTTYMARGSSVISGSIDSHLSLGHSKVENRSRKIHATWAKGRGADEFPEFWYRMTWDEKEVTFATDADKPRGDRAWENAESAGKAVSWNRLQVMISTDSENLADVARQRGWTKKMNDQGKSRWYPPAPKDRQIDPLGGNRGDSAG